MELQLLNTAASLGLGGFIAVIVLLWKRTDDQRYSESLRQINDRLLTLVEANISTMRELKEAINALANIRDLEVKLAGMEERLRRHG